MELIKKNIHMSREKGTFTSQVTKHELLSLPDSVPKMEVILMEQHHIVLEQVRTSEERVELNGRLTMEVLYLSSDSGQMERLEHSIPFSETMNCSGLTQMDLVRPSLEVEDVSLHLYHSDQLEMNVILNLKIQVREGIDAMVALCPENRKTGANFLKKEMEVLQLRIARKEAYRWKEEIELGSGKPAIGKVLWKTLELRGFETRTSNGNILLRGEILLFLMYEGEEPHIPLQWMEQSIHFSGELPMNGCTTDMIADIGVCLTDPKLEVKPDYEGEPKLLSLEANLQLQVDLYEEETVSVIHDVYSPEISMIPEYLEGNFEHLLVKNNARCKVNEKVTLKPHSNVLQICHAKGEWKLDRMSWVEHGILLEGAIQVSLLYMTTDDNDPLKMQQLAVPFSYTVEILEHTPETIYRVRPGLEHLSAVLLGADEVEIRAGLSFDTMVVECLTQQLIISVREEAQDQKLIEELPGIVGYIVGEQDTLWSIAKRYYTTVDHIRQINGLSKDQVAAGDRLLLVKEVPNTIPKGQISRKKEVS